MLYKQITLMFIIKIPICRMIIEQMNCEREKLKYDVDTANNRAAMLAQEVDENHMRLEKSLTDKIA